MDKVGLEFEQSSCPCFPSTGYSDIFKGKSKIKTQYGKQKKGRSVDIVITDTEEFFKSASIN